MTQEVPDPEAAAGVVLPHGNRTADDPFDRKRLERLKDIADPLHPENDPLADVDAAVVSPGDGGTTGPDEMDDLDWDADVTLEGDIESTDSE